MIHKNLCSGQFSLASESILLWTDLKEHLAFVSKEKSSNKIRRNPQHVLKTLHQRAYQK